MRYSDDIHQHHTPILQSLEPRLLLSGTTPVPADAGIPDGYVDSIMYERRIDYDETEEYQLGLDVNASLVDDITIQLPWGETTKLSDYLPVGWNGEYFEIELDQGDRWLSIEIESLGYDSDPTLDLYYYGFDYEIQSSAVDADLLLQACEVVPLELTVDLSVGADWNQTLDFDKVPMPDVTPEITQPSRFASLNSLQPTITWNPWTTAPEIGKVAFWMADYDETEEFFQWWPASDLPSQFTPDHNLMADQAYEFSTEFYNQVFSDIDGVFVDTKSIIESDGAFVVDVTPGGYNDIAANQMQALASETQAGSLMPASIDIINNGSDPVFFPWQIFLSTDSTWDASDRLVIDTTEGMAPGQLIQGQGNIRIPANTISGSYHLIMVLDPDNLISETNESNNIAVSEPFTVTAPANHNPTALLDIFQSPRNNQLIISFDDLTDNDFDYDDDSISIIAVNEIEQTHGTLDVSGDQITYTPALNYTGPARFQYTIEDTAGLQATAIVNIAVDQTGPYLYMVDSLADVVASDGMITLREAIEAANTNSAVTDDLPAGSDTETDHIIFDPTLTGGTIILGGTQLDITDDLEIQGLAQNNLTIDANGLSRVFSITGTEAVVNISGLEITGGHIVDGQGGGIYSNADLTIDDVVIVNNSSIGTLGDGGGLYTSGSLTMTNSSVSNNTGGWNGGGIHVEAGTADITNTTISNNRVSGTVAYGGGIYIYSGATLILNSSSVMDNQIYGINYAEGGGIFNGETLIINDSILSGNSSNQEGGAIYNSGGYDCTATLNNTTITNNTARSGGGLYNVSTMTLVHSTVSNNTATGYDSENDGGGGLYNSFGSSLTLISTTVSNNTARNTNLYGGGIFNDLGDVTVVNSTLSNNSARRGGAIYNLYGNTVISNSIIVGNWGGYYAGGIYNHTYSDLTITNSTITGNYGGYGGGICTFAKDEDGHHILILNNSIVALNQAVANADIKGSFANNNSLVSTDPAFIRNPSDGGDGWIDDPTTIDVNESANNDYGDLRLQSSSPAINTGDNTLLPADEFDLDNDGDTTESLPVDLDGNPRVSAGTVDIGAYEKQILPGDTNLDNHVDLIDLVTLGENYNQPGQWAQGDFNGDHFVDLLDLVTLGENYNSPSPLTADNQNTLQPQLIDNPITPANQTAWFHTLDNLLTKDDDPSPLQLF